MNRILQTINLHNVIVSIAYNNHVHLCDLGRALNLMAIYCLFLQKSNVFRRLAAFVLNMSECFNQKSTRATCRVIHLVAKLRVYQINYQLHNMPRHIVKLVVDLVDPKFGDKVYDPACGTGGFLIEAFRHIKNKCSQTPKNIRFLKEETIYGHEI